VSVKWGTRERLSRAVPYGSAKRDRTRAAQGSARRGLGPQSYRKKTEASQATASQVAAQNPSDRSNTMVKDAPSDH